MSIVLIFLGLVGMPCASPLTVCFAATAMAFAVLGLLARPGIVFLGLSVLWDRTCVPTVTMSVCLSRAPPRLYRFRPRKIGGIVPTLTLCFVPVGSL